MNEPIAKLHKDFERQMAKPPPKQRDKIINAINRFLDNPTERSLRNHPLKGEWQGFHSISAGGDLRLYFKMISENTVLFVAVGSHSQLYR